MRSDATPAQIDQVVEVIRGQGLTPHPLFGSTFASANQTGFNRADGAGYDFFAQTILEIDGSNPQLAARLATALRSWRCLEPDRQRKAKAALLSIAAAQELSTDVRDIVERTLA